MKGFHQISLGQNLKPYSLVPWVATTATWARARARGAGLSRTPQNTATCPV